MSVVRHGILLLVMMVLVISCAEEPWEEVLLADYAFNRGRMDLSAGTFYGEDCGIHWFAKGWFCLPSDKGVWSLGRESELQLYVLGKMCHLTFKCSTHPELAQAGQNLTVLVNEHELGRFSIGEEWVVENCAVNIPDDWLEQGYNTITFRASHHRSQGMDPQDPRPLAIFFRELQARCLMNSKQLKKWRQANTVPPLPEDWNLVYRSAVPTSSSQQQKDAQAVQSMPSLPDLLIVLIDAANASHLSCYGYSRQTTPHIDELARDGVRLRNVFANAPFTLIAVPSLLTGLSWRDHDVVQNGQALADSITTLPEMMRDAGYLTMCYSDNPFVSVATGQHQGFDEFTEVWKDSRHGGAGENPELIEQMLAQRATVGFDERPVMCFLHLMPPHAPYIPGPKHDLWSDPHYQGDIDGSAEILDDIVEGKRQVSEADRQKIIDLYDGNLHRIDASVGRIIESWRALTRERQLLVVVLSDHGEAFGEHGQYQHLTTVYDEMLHIPLILWPQAQWHYLSGHEGKLYGITDVAPMILHKLGLDPPENLRHTRRFWRLLADPTLTRDVVVARTTIHAHQYGLRNSRYLAIFDNFTGQELYDLDQDPLAQRNLRLAQPARYRELLGILRIILAAGTDNVAEEAELSDQDLETLRSLGYL